MSAISNFITTGNFKSLELVPKELFRRLEDHTSKVKEMFDLVIDELTGVRSGIDDAAAKILITAQENTEAYVGGSGAVDHALLSNLNYAAAGHVGFEPAIGNPSVSGYILSSTTLGVRSWIANTVGTVTDVTAASPLFSSGGATPQITIQEATTLQNGYMNSAQVIALASKIGDAAGSIAHDGVTYGRKNESWVATASGGSVTEVSVVTNDGVSGSVANPTTTPAITLTLGTITPTAVTIDAGNVYKIGTAVLARLVDTENWFLGGSGNATLTGVGNIALGGLTLESVTSGNYNFGVGYNVLPDVTTGSSNVAVGNQSGLIVTTGGSNVFLGAGSGSSVTTGGNNVFLGANADAGSNVSDKFILKNPTNTLLNGTFHATASSQTLYVYSGDTRLGSDPTTNYTKFDSTGHQVMVGTAKPWDDLRVEPVARTTGANAPTFRQWFDDSGIGDTGSTRGVYLYEFDNAVGGSEKELFFTMQMPHAWDDGEVHLHVHWIAESTAATSKVRWGLEYTWAAVHGTFPATQTIIYADTPESGDTGTTAGKHQITEFAALNPPDGLSTIIIGRLFRDSANGADTYTGDAGLLYIDAHFQLSTLGSTDEYTK